MMESKEDSMMSSASPGLKLLAGKLCLVTGATSGIGLATAKTLVREGAKVCASGRNKKVLERLQQELGSALVIADGDLTQNGVCKAVVESAVKQMGGLTTLVNCAGVLKGGALGSDACDLDNFMFNFNPNTKAVFEMMHHSIPHLKQAGKDAGPSILNVSSVNGLVSFGGVASYCASKAATDMLTKCAAVDLAPHGLSMQSYAKGFDLHRYRFAISVLRHSLYHNRS